MYKQINSLDKQSLSIIIYGSQCSPCMIECFLSLQTGQTPMKYATDKSMEELLLSARKYIKLIVNGYEK